MPKHCKYYKKMRTKGHNKCLRDGSIRHGSCTCPYYVKSIFGKIIDWLFNT